jgi:histidine triad (HIT) family protein
MENNDDCIFCKIARGDISNKRVYEDDNFFAILDINPKAEGHTLLIPKKHFKNILDMPSSLAGEMIDAVKKIGLRLVEEGRSEGFNLCVNTGESAGQTVNHFHLHIIPRKKGDGLKGLVE